jgi:hypothetical protein
MVLMLWLGGFLVGWGLRGLYELLKQENSDVSR